MEWDCSYFSFSYQVCYVGQATLELTIFPPQPPGCWDCSPQVILKYTEGWDPVITTGTPLIPTLANA